MAKSKTKLKEQLRRKTNSEIVLAIREGMKHKGWQKVVENLAGPECNYSALNLRTINDKVSAGDTIVIIGKVLSLGELSKKIKICAMSISAKARDKLKESKSEFVSLVEEIKKNPKAEGIKILK